MPSTLVKVTFGLAGVTTVGGGATAIYLNSKSTKTQEENKPTEKVSPVKSVADKLIKSLFDEAKIQLLGNEGADAGKWTEKWNNFKDDYENLTEKEAWKFDNWESAKSTQDPSIAILKQKCTANIEKKVVDKSNQLFLDVQKYCTKPIGG